MRLAVVCDLLHELARIELGQLTWIKAHPIDLSTIAGVI